MVPSQSTPATVHFSSCFPFLVDPPPLFFFVLAFFLLLVVVDDPGGEEDAATETSAFPFGVTEGFFFLNLIVITGGFWPLRPVRKNSLIDCALFYEDDDNAF